MAASDMSETPATIAEARAAVDWWMRHCILTTDPEHNHAVYECPEVETKLDAYAEIIARESRKAAEATLELTRDLIRLHGQHHHDCYLLRGGHPNVSGVECNCWLSFTLTADASKQSGNSLTEIE